MAPSDASAAKPTIEPIQLLVMANRVDGIVREMTNTLVRTAQSATLAARDLSCSLSTAEHELFAAPEGCPVHVYGSGLLCEAMQEMHPDFEEGDAFLHNDPYLGNTHAADWTILVPVFYAGEHIFTACVKAHQADTGNAIRTTYSPEAVDVYAEGALIFPCVRIQEHYADVGDIIRMCQKRIRIPEIWYGDHLAMIRGRPGGRAGDPGLLPQVRAGDGEDLRPRVAGLLRAHDHGGDPRTAGRRGRGVEHGGSVPQPPRWHPAARQDRGRPRGRARHGRLPRQPGTARPPA